jgi:pyrroloquinoline-quinone synthase
MFDKLHSVLDQFHLLQHPFYKMWSEGNLTTETLQDYAKQYYHHVYAFPRYVSAIHSKCDSPDIKTRQVILHNLIDEEDGTENHPELWLRFAEGLGVSREDVKSATLNQETKELVEGFFALCNRSYAHGLGALYAYERQVPDVAKSKIEGLKMFYGIEDDRTTKFFSVHIKADEWHSQEVRDLIAALPENERKITESSAISAATLLWRFLDGMNVVCDDIKERRH